MSSDDSAATVRDTSPGLTRRSVIILIFVLAIAAVLIPKLLSRRSRPAGHDLLRTAA